MSFTTYKSSAGSGKTTTLVVEYLTIALQSQQPDHYRRILAITFTNKAAQEMKERVMNSLRSFSQNAPNQQRYPVIYTKVKDALQLTDQQLKSRATETLKHILHNYSDFSISTIDSFTHKIIRTFAHDLKLPINFEVDLDNDALIKKSIDLLISRIGENPALTNTLVAFSTSKTAETKSWRIGDDLKEFARLLLRDDYDQYLEQLREVSLDRFIAARKEINKNIAALEAGWKNNAQAFLDILTKNQLDYSQLARGSKGVGFYFRRIAQEDFSRLTPTDSLSKAIANNLWTAKNGKKEIVNAVASIADELTQAAQKTIDTIASEKAQYVLQKDLNKYLYQMAVLREIELEMQQYKADNNIMSISEFNRKISAIVMNEPAPFIYERLGERYHHYLIDEFQDTSESQWKNLLPLLSNALSQGTENQTYFNMVVGDGKQSIYRWRGGDADQFVQLPQVKGAHESLVLKEHEQVLVRNHEEKVLDANYRSKREVIEFNNWLFSSIAEKEEGYIHEVYKEIHQNFREENTGGFVHFETYNYQDAEEFNQYNLDQIIPFINECVEDGYQWSDICILFRTNKAAIQVANLLVKNQIDVLSSESLLLKNDNNIQAIIAFLKWIVQPEEKLAAAQLVSSIHSLKIIDFSLHLELQKVADKSKNPALVIQELLQQLQLDNLANKLQSLSIYEGVQFLVHALSIHEKPSAYVTAFLQVAHNFSTKKSNHLKDFIDYWNQKSENLSISVPEGSNAVQIMTIHKSKGLEFPVVILPFVNWSTTQKGEKKKWIALDEDKYQLPTGLIGLSQERLESTPWEPLVQEENTKTMLDNLNILYVACTRPVDRLYGIVGTKGKPGIGFSNQIKAHFETHADWDENHQILEFGSRTQLKSKDSPSASDSAAVFLETSKTANWREQLQLAVSSPWKQKDEVSEAKKFGEILHYLLSLDKPHNLVLVELNQLIKTGWVPTNMKNRIEEALEHVQQFTPYQDLLSKSEKTWNEREFIHPKWGVLRPDKICFFDQQAVVIDFKTGSYRKKHEKQVLQYMQLLEELGHTNVSGVLFYLDQMKWITVENNAEN